jgi:hypothetical protein
MANKTQSQMKTTTDHGEVRRWVEEHGGMPAIVRGSKKDGSVLRSLMEHLELRTAEEIAGAPHASAEIDAGAARAGLRELRQQGLAAEDAGGRWHVTDSGCEAHQRA